MHNAARSEMWNRLAYAATGIFCARKATFRHRESKASKTPATVNRGGNS